LMLPLFALLALVSKLTSPGPVFFRQDRVGRAGRRFRIVKFRTMQLGADRHGPLVTAKGDPRVTSLGRILRRSKLDELPQLWNVFTGDMSLVGPRPEVPLYVAAYSEEQRCVLAVRPGLTDPASIAYWDEEQRLAAHPEPERYYRDVILAQKLSLSLEYIQRITLSRDLLILAGTAAFVVGVRGFDREGNSSPSQREPSAASWN